MLQHTLREEHCKCLDKVLESIPKTLALAEACKDCGWDVDYLIEALKAQQAMAQKAKAHFFPNRL